MEFTKSLRDKNWWRNVSIILWKCMEYSKCEKCQYNCEINFQQLTCPGALLAFCVNWVCYLIRVYFEFAEFIQNTNESLLFHSPRNGEKTYFDFRNWIFTKFCLIFQKNFTCNFFFQQVNSPNASQKCFISHRHVGWVCMVTEHILRSTNIWNKKKTTMVWCS